MDDKSAHDLKTTRDVELDQLPTLARTTEDVLDVDAGPQEGTTLKPVDTGFGAWSFLFAAFAVETLVWGLPVSYGVFQVEYLRDPVYASQPGASTLLPMIGPLCTGIMYCTGVLIYPLMSRLPYIRRYLAYAGAAICWSSLLGASFTTDVRVLLFLQGICYGVGGSMLYSPCISYMSEWFVARRGFANGMINCGTSLGGLVLPLALPVPLHKLGPAKTMRILSVALLVVLLPGLPFIRSRLPEVRNCGPVVRRQHHDRSYLKNYLFWVLMAMNITQGFAYYIPAMWLPTFASSVDLTVSQSALTVALLNGASAIGRLMIGSAADVIDPWLIAFVTLITTTGAVFILWGVLAHTLSGLLAFGFVYGIIAGSFCSLWACLVRPIAKDDPALTTTLFSFLLLTNGIGSIVSTPIASQLTKVGRPLMDHIGRTSVSTGFKVDNGRYETLILFVGVCFAASTAVSMFGWLAQKKGRL